MAKPSSGRRPPGFSAQRRLVSELEGRREHDRLRRAAVPLLGCGILALPTQDGSEIEMPIAYLDCRRRPDVADLARVHRLEGEGDQVATWTFCLAPGVPGVESLAVLDLRLVRPVRCRFSIAFEMISHAAILNAIVKAEKLIVAHRDPTAAESYREILIGTVGFDVPGDQLRQALLMDEVARLGIALFGGRGQ